MKRDEGERGEKGGGGERVRMRILEQEREEVR